MITAVGMVKNAADVIETMIRGNSLVVDNFVLFDNASTDNTIHILERLVSEGIHIDILKDDNISPYQKLRVTEGIKYAIDKYHPDFILPIDDDEVICTNDSSSDPYRLKNYIESLDQNDLYYLRWRNYIPTDEDNLSVISPALRLKYCLDDEPDMTKKVLIPAKIAEEKDFSIAWGAHFAECGKIRNHVELTDVRMAHYPIRNSIQITAKTIVGWINALAMPDRGNDISEHLRVMYTAIKEYGLPTTDTMMTLVNLYREHPNDTENLNVIYNPINIPDHIFELKYTGAREINLFKNICENIERITEDYARVLRKLKELKTRETD